VGLERGIHRLGRVPARHLRTLHQVGVVTEQSRVDHPPSLSTAPADYGESMTDPSTGERHAAVVYNPVKVDAAALRRGVEKRSAEAGWAEPRFFETTTSDLGDGVTRE